MLLAANVTEADSSGGHFDRLRDVDSETVAENADKQKDKISEFDFAASTSDSLDEKRRCVSSASGHRFALFRLISTGAVVVLGGSFHFGYQISLINPLADVLQTFLERGLRE